MPVAPAPYLSRDKYVLDGRMTTRRSARMTREARHLFLARGGGSHPRIVQGGWSGSVSASAGTHAYDAKDEGLSGWTAGRRLLWERCNWEVGFAGWIRPYIKGLWGWHFHALPKGGWLAPGAQSQITQWHQGDNALANDQPYPRINSSGLRTRTWESYLKMMGRSVTTNEPRAQVDLSGVVAAFKARKPTDKAQDSGDNDVQQIQRRLNFYLGIDMPVDGIPGPMTVGSYATFQARIYGVKKWSEDANGIPGKSSLWNMSLKVVA